MKKYLDHLFADSRLIELRHQVCKRWSTGWFDNSKALHRAVLERQDQGNLFTSLHRPFGRAISNTMSGSALSGDGVDRYTRLLFDFDPEREPNTASTDEQVALGKAKAEDLIKVLRPLGWPEPLQAMSGNGWHLQYRIALPNNQETREKLCTLYRGLAGEFSDDLVKFDPFVRNPARICTLYGSVKRKGSDPAQHRRSQAWIPPDWQEVPHKSFEGVVDFYARQRKTMEVIQRPVLRSEGHGDYKTLDVVAWFHAHGHYHRPSGEAGKHFVRCPWEDRHSDGIDAQVVDTVVWEPDGNWPTFHCSHAHCEGRTIRDVMNIWGDADAFCIREWHHD